MKRLGSTFILFIALSVILAAQGYRVEKKLTVSSEESFPENILSWKGDIAIAGRLEQSVFMVGGKLLVKGVVDQDVICIGTHVTLMENSIIKGELLLIGGTQARRSGARIDGGHFHFHYDWKSLRSSLHPILSDQRSLGFFRAAKIIIWFVIALLTFVLFPTRVIAAKNILADRGWRIGLAGLLALAAFFVFAVISLLLSFVLIGIPLLFLLIVAYFAVMVFGRTVFFYYLGSGIMKLLGRPTANATWFLLTGAVVYGGLKFIPMAGAVILLLFNLLEIGIGTVFLLRLRPVFQRER